MTNQITRFNELQSELIQRQQANQQKPLPEFMRHIAHIVQAHRVQFPTFGNIDEHDIKIRFTTKALELHPEGWGLSESLITKDWFSTVRFNGDFVHSYRLQDTDMYKFVQEIEQSFTSLDPNNINQVSELHYMCDCLSQTIRAPEFGLIHIDGSSLTISPRTEFGNCSFILKTDLKRVMICQNMDIEDMGTVTKVVVTENGKTSEQWFWGCDKVSSLKELHVVAALQGYQIPNNFNLPTF